MISDRPSRLLDCLLDTFNELAFGDWFCSSYFLSYLRTTRPHGSRRALGTLLLIYHGSLSHFVVR